MSDEEAFVQGIPSFLRRPVEPIPDTPLFMAPPPASPPSAHIPDLLKAPDEVPVRRPGSLARLAVPADDPVPESAEGRNDVVSLPRHRAPLGVTDMASPADFFSDARAGIEALLDGEVQDPQDETDDAAFQVTLPRSVIRQIRILAAREGTTQRAVVLKALRLAGLAVPKGADIDRRILAARRRQQA